METPQRTIILIPETPYSPLKDIQQKMNRKRYEVDERSFYTGKVTKSESAETSKQSPYFRVDPLADTLHTNDVEILSALDFPSAKKRKLVRKESRSESVDLEFISEKVIAVEDEVVVVKEVTHTELEPAQPEPEELDEFEQEALLFLNTSSHSDIISSLKCTVEQADFLIEKRPFSDFTTFESTLFKIIKKYVNALQNFGSVDDIIHHCDVVGREVKRTLDQWNDIQKGALLTPKYPIYTTQPDIINQELQLKQYQLTGISWMMMLYKMNLGGILADEMGLGKTAQTVSFLAMLKQENELKKALIIVPSSTLDNWMREIEMWCPLLEAIAYTGSQKERRELQYEITSDSYDIIVTTYNQATGNSDDRRFLRSLKCQVLILDEGHMIKNGDSQRAKHLKSFQSPFKLLLTGTPIQNNLMELLALLIFINPKLFEPAQASFASIFDKTNTAQEGLEGDVAKKRIERAAKILTPFVLRRRKDEVRKDIPTKTRLIEYCEPTVEQVELYHSIMKASKKAYLESETEFLKSKQKKKKEQSSTGLSNILMQLRKVANHQLLVRRLYSDDMLPLVARDLKRVPMIN